MCVFLHVRVHTTWPSKMIGIAKQTRKVLQGWIRSDTGKVVRLSSLRKAFSKSKTDGFTYHLASEGIRAQVVADQCAGEKLDLRGALTVVMES